MTFKERTAKMAAKSPWLTHGVVTVSAGTIARSFKDISKAVDHAVNASTSRYYRTTTVEVCYMGPDDACSGREHSAHVVRSVFVAHGECVGIGKRASV